MVARRYGSRPWFVRIARSLVPVDRFLGRLTRGRFVALSMREVPSLMITTTGRMSGQPRSNPLVYAPDGDAFVVIGSNWGQTHHPAWSGNLLAAPGGHGDPQGRRHPRPGPARSPDPERARSGSQAASDLAGVRRLRAHGRRPATCASSGSSGPEHARAPCYRRTRYRGTLANAATGARRQASTTAMRSASRAMTASGSPWVCPRWTSGISLCGRSTARMPAPRAP